jgi:hypothetical protein
MTGPLVLSGNPTNANEAANKAFVDGFLPLSGGTMTGNLVIREINPTLDNTFSMGHVGCRMANVFSTLLSYQTLVQTSDSRLKTDITDTSDDFLSVIKSMRLRNFKWINDPEAEQQLGVIAQEVREVAPEYADARDESHLSVRTDRLTYALIGAVQRLSDRIDALESRLSVTNM